MDPSSSSVLNLEAITVSFQVVGEHPKKPGTSVDITFRKKADGHVLAYLLNAGAQHVWAPRKLIAHSLLLGKVRQLRRCELADCCLRLSWFPDPDESVILDVHVLVTFEDGTQVERMFVHKKVSNGGDDADKQHTLGMFPM